MSERYWITGVQLGILKALVSSEIDNNTEIIIKQLEEIEDKQFIGNVNSQEFQRALKKDNHTDFPPDTNHKQIKDSVDEDY